MAYAGSTAGSSVANPPVLTQSWLAGSTAGQGGSTETGAMQQWLYRSTHVQTDVDNAGFITDAQILGMRLGDSVLAVSSSAYIISHHVVNAISSTGCTLSAGLLVSSAS